VARLESERPRRDAGVTAESLGGTEQIELRVAKENFGAHDVEASGRLFAKFSHQLPTHTKIIAELDVKVNLKAFALD
jgi:hypothetical protein